MPDSGSLEVIRAHETLFLDAEQHEREGRHHEAVIIAQTCCEMVAARAIRALQGAPVHSTADYADLVTDAFPKHRDNSYSMLSFRSLAAWRALTGDALSKAAFWDEYDKHVTRRNRVAHRGDRISPADAARSMAAARSFLAHVTQQANAVIGTGW